MQIKTSKKLAAYLGCSNSAVSRWLERGLPHEVDEGIVYVYDVEEVLKWLWNRSRRHKSWVRNLQKRLAKERAIVEKNNERLDKATQKNA